jgi:peptidoglycan/LPS O-acetylase OafA/YrhL
VRQIQLDGVRGIAMLSVFMCHHFLFPIGWAGVDLFFVLSGFLITRTLVETKHHQNYWAQFYIKRSGRILPPLVPLFLVVAILSRRLTLVGFAGYALFLGNYINLTPYGIEILIVLWSLAIEEHYYLIWPTVVRFLSRGRCITVCLIILLIEPLLRAVVTIHVASFYPIYYLTWFRLDGIVAGSLLALVVPLERVHNWLRNSAIWIFSAFVLSYFVLGKLEEKIFTKEENSVLFNSLGYTIIALACFFLVAYLVLKEDSYLSRLLSVRPLVFLGEISYGMYLFHMVTLAILRRIFHVGVGLQSIHGTRLLFLVNFPLVICLTWLSFRFYESPIIKWSRRKARIFEHAEIEDAART